MSLNGIDHVELWGGNAARAASFYERAFGFRSLGVRRTEELAMMWDKFHPLKLTSGYAMSWSEDPIPVEA